MYHGWRGVPCASVTRWTGVCVRVVFVCVLGVYRRTHCPAALRTQRRSVYLLACHLVAQGSPSPLQLAAACSACLDPLQQEGKGGRAWPPVSCRQQQRPPGPCAAWLLCFAGQHLGHMCIQRVFLCWQLRPCTRPASLLLCVRHSCCAALQQCSVSVVLFFGLEWLGLTPAPTVPLEPPPASAGDGGWFWRE